MPAILTGLASAICAAGLVAISGQGIMMIFLAYVLAGIAGLLLGAWRMVLVADKESATSGVVNKTFIAKKDKPLGH